MIFFTGFKVGFCNIDHQPREKGKSSYNIRRSLSLAADIITYNSDRPLKIILATGVSFCIIAVIIGLYFISRKLAGVEIPLGWTSLLIAIVFFGGLTTTMIGIVGLYVANIFDETKIRPDYFIDQVIN